jgi:hypothetical protein
MAERIGVVFVHGIGEQRRFDHLDWQIRPLIEALMRRPHTALTVEIVGANASTLRAEQDTWSTDGKGPVRALVRDTESGDEKELVFHEVWWADVNEPYSLWKQIKFWFWGLSVWAVPGQDERQLAGAGAMRLPVFPGRFSTIRWLFDRVKLFAVSNVFLLGALSIGLVNFLTKRLLDWEILPGKVRVLVNYVSAVKLYSQSRRAGGGFLDAYHEPPRVSVRRRMIRTLADVAREDYARWYVIAHSLGSVVAYNGLMETGHAMANYLDEARWRRLSDEPDKDRLGGRNRGGDYVTPLKPDGSAPPMLPPRPLWLDWDELVYRDRLLSKFRGLFTYGSPLDKFAFIWPPRVPINTAEPMFPDAAEWVNVYDPLDPVGASLDAFSPVDGGRLIKPANYGYRAGWVLLLSHLRYFKSGRRRDALSDLVVDWMLCGNSFTRTHDADAKPFYKPGSGPEHARAAVAKVTWLAVYVALAVAAVLVWRWLFRSTNAPFEFAQPIWDRMKAEATVGNFAIQCLIVMLGAAGVTLLAGILHNLKLNRDEKALEDKLTP